MWRDATERKEKMEKDKNENTMWPEKVDIIYEQFGWLSRIYPKWKVDRAFVKRFDESSLDIVATRQFLGSDSDVSVFTVEVTHREWGRGEPIGQEIKEKRKLSSLFVKHTYTRYYEQSVREAIRWSLGDSKENYLVQIHHRATDSGKTVLTVFKPPEKGKTLKQWYDARVALLDKEISEEIEKT